jgi:dihydrodipicolinate synthase/N-acetylneuraminate lyase
MGRDGFGLRAARPARSIACTPAVHIAALTSAHRQVDYACIEELVEWHVKEGTAGIVPCGTTGESPTLSEEEHFKVIETVVKKAAGRIQVRSCACACACARACAWLLALTADAHR